MQIGPYEVLDEIARGGMGVVYRARHQGLGREVALKVLLAGAQATPQRRERFQLEAQAAARLRHPNVVAIHDVGEANGHPYLVMDLIEGEGLDRRLEREGPLPAKEAARLIRQVAGAMAAAHDHLILHRDLKPANILVDRQGQAMLTDFGLAKVLEPGGPSGPTQSGQMLGTPSYMAPEQASTSLPVDWRTDVYGLGATLYALLVGEAPFVGDSVMEVIAAVLRSDPEPPSRLADVPRDLETICLTCLEKEPGRRYPGARALAADLDRFLGDESILARRPGLGERAWRWARRNQALTAVSVGALLGVILVGGGAVGWARGNLTREARAAALRSWEACESSAEGDEDERLGLALSALQAAQRWHDLAPGVEAAKARHRAALTLGEIALQGEQWSLAREAYRQAKDLGIDEDDVRGRLQGVEEMRQAEARRRREATLALLARAERGELRAQPEGLLDAVFELVRYPDLQTVELLSTRLGEVAASLAQVAGGSEDLARRAAAQREAVGQGRLDLARVACDALGRIGTPEPTTAALGAYLRAEADELRALPAAVALCRLGGEEALAHVHDARRRFGVNSTFSLRIEHDLSRIHQAPGLEKETAEGYQRRGEARQAQGDLAGAIGDYTRAIELDPTLAPAWSNRGNAKNLSGDPQGALADLDKAIELASGEAFYWHNRGVVYYTQGDPRRAQPDFDRAIELDPKLAEAWSMRGLARRAQGDRRGALGDLDRAIELGLKDAGVFLNRASVRHDLGDVEAALADLDHAIEVDPRAAKAWNNRGFMRLNKGDTQGARADFDRALELRPGSSSTHYNRAKARQALGDLEGALADFDRAIELDPGIGAEAWFRRGAVRQLRGDHAGALTDYDRALDLDPRHVSARHNRGIARTAQGDMQGGLDDLQRFLELAPDSPQAGPVRAILKRAGRIGG